MRYIITDLIHLLSRRWVKLSILAATAVWMVVLAWPRLAWPLARSTDWLELEIIFCDVGQGDAILIQQGFHQVLVDGGPNNQALDCLDRYLPFFDREIDAVIVSHPQTDHFSALTAVIESYNVRFFVYNGFAGQSRRWEELSAAVVREEGIRVVEVEEGDSFKIGRIKLDVLWPRSPSLAGFKPSSAGGSRPEENKVLGTTSPRDLNVDSLVLWLSYGDFDALLTGDIGATEEAQITNYQLPITTSLEVLKVPHHGSRYSSSAPFLKALKPVLAVIQVGGNPYGHPAADTLERLEAVGSRTRRTDQDGDVVIRTDGKNWRVQVTR